MLYQAKCQYDAAHAVFKPYEALRLAEDKLDLRDNIRTAANALKTQKETTETRRADAEQHAVNELGRFKAKRDEGMALLKHSLETIEKEEQSFLFTSKSHLETVRKQNNIEATVEHHDMIKTRKKKAETDLAYQSFAKLLHVIKDLGPLYTTPLRYTVKLVSGKLLKIRKIEIDGKWSSMAKDGKLNAHITAVIGFVSVVLHVSFDVGDILFFLTELWKEIGKLMNSVGGTIKHFLEEGQKVAKEAVEIALVEGKRFVEDADKALAPVAVSIEELDKDLGHDVENVVDRAEDLRKDVVRAADKFIEGAIKKTVTVTPHVEEKPAETIVHAAEALQHGVETAEHEIDHALSNAAKDAGHTIQHAAEKTEKVVTKAKEVVEETLSNFGRGLTNLWRS